jgi:hypothetical protein
MNSVSTGFWEWTSLLSSGERVGLLIFGIFAFVFLVTIITCTIYQIHKNRLEDSLKRELLDRGMSADEIATIVGRAQKPKRS